MTSPLDHRLINEVFDLLESRRVAQKDSEPKSDVPHLRRRIAELEDLAAGNEIRLLMEKRRADLLESYMGKVFWFCIAYAVSALTLILLVGAECIEFSLPNSTVNFIAGSGTVSVVSLLGAMLTGLFRADQTAEIRNQKRDTGST